MTPGCQGESGGAMAVEGNVGESQLQRIIRDLHGTLPLCVCLCACVRLVADDFFLNNVTERRRKKVSYYAVTSGTLSLYYKPGTIWQLLFNKSVWEMGV